jgi:hypothetical protein
LDHLRPAECLATEFEIARKLLDKQLTGLMVRSMKGDAELRQGGFVRSRSVCGTEPKEIQFI